LINSITWRIYVNIKNFIQNSFGEKWKKFIDKIAIHATKDFKNDLE